MSGRAKPYPISQILPDGFKPFANDSQYGAVRPLKTMRREED
jgi:hypothetical protein